MSSRAMSSCSLIPPILVAAHLYSAFTNPRSLSFSYDSGPREDVGPCQASETTCS